MHGLKDLSHLLLLSHVISASWIEGGAAQNQTGTQRGCHVTDKSSLHNAMVPALRDHSHNDSVSQMAETGRFVSGEDQEPESPTHYLTTCSWVAICYPPR